MKYQKKTSINYVWYISAIIFFLIILFSISIFSCKNDTNNEELIPPSAITNETNELPEKEIIIPKELAPPSTVGSFENEGLSAQTEWRIIQDYFNNCGQYYGPNTLYSLLPYYHNLNKYYGTYNGCVAFTMNTDGKIPYFKPDIGPNSIDDILISYIDINNAIIYYRVIIAWKEGKFYRLRDAYDLGLLEYENIIMIKNLHVKEYPQCYTPDIEPWKGNFDGLDAETEKIINQDYIDLWSNPLEKLIRIPENKYFEYYYGTYNNFVIVYRKGQTFAFNTIYISNIAFTFPSGGQMYGWKQDINGIGFFYNIKEINERGYLSIDDVNKMYEIHQSIFPPKK